jgi:hypothetical protein
MFAKIGEINMTDGWLLDSDLGEALHENEIEIAQQIAVYKTLHFDDPW